MRLVIDGEPDLTVVAEAADGDAAITVVDRRPSVGHSKRAGSPAP